MDPVLLIIQLLMLLLFAPLLQGVIKTTKAKIQGRQGPGILQPCRDVSKWLARESVESDRASAVFRYAPAFYAAGVLLAALLVPMISQSSPLPAWGDAIVFAGLLAFARFALALAAFDTASNFGGMGATREMSFAALVEPALLLVIFAVTVTRGSTNFTTLASHSHLGVTEFLGLGALLIVIIAETGRIPIDNPDTHLELTMAHEGMILEYSGRPLGIIHWVTMIKQMALIGLAIALFVPWGIADAGDHSAAAMAIGVGSFLIKALVFGLVLAMIESSVAKLRVFRAPDLIGLGSVLALLAVMAAYVTTP